MPSSPEPESLPKKKKPGRPKFNKVQIKKRKPAATQDSADEPTPKPEPTPADAAEPPVAEEDKTLSFFHRSKESYVAPEPKQKKRASEQSSESPSTKRGRAYAGDDSDSDDDSLEERRRHAEQLRQRYQERGRDYGSEDSDSGTKTIDPKKPRKAVVREDSLTPPPQVVPPPQINRRPAPPTRRRPETRSPVVSLDSDSDGVPAAGAADRDAVTPAESADEQDEVIARIEARARARLLSAQPESTEPIIDILITSPIDQTKPLIVRRRLDQTLREARVHWCKAQGFTPARTEEIFLVWKNRHKLMDRVSCKGVGVTVDSDAEPNREGFLGGRVHFVAMTEEIFQRVLRGADEEPEEGTKEEEEEEEGETLRLMFRSKAKDEFKLKVRKTTTIASIIEAYRKAMKVDAGKQVRLDFEGDTLEPDDAVADTELDDMCMVEVYIS